MRPLASAGLGLLMLWPPTVFGAQGLDARATRITVRSGTGRPHPGDDFYAYANGAWMRRAKIPADQDSCGVWEALENRTERRLAAILRGAARAPKGSELRKAGDLFASYLDEAALEAAGTAPLRPRLARIAAVKDRRDLAVALGETLRADVDVLNANVLDTPNLFGLWVAADLQEPSRHVPYLLQGGLGMPDRSYYLDPSPAMAALRGCYQAHVAALFTLLGVEEAQAKAAAVLQLETRIAHAHASREESADVLKGYNPWPRAAFAERAPGLDWEAYFKAAGLAAPDAFVVWQPWAFAGLSALVAREPLDAWKAYLVFHAVRGAAPFLPKAFAEASFAFYGKALRGAEKAPPRWKLALAFTQGAMGEALGKAYVQRHFSPRAGARAQVLVENIRTAFRRRIEGAEWLSPDTKAAASAKLAALRVSVGAPDRWTDYRGLEVRTGDPYGNAQRAARFAYLRDLQKLGRPVDRDAWVMTPQTVSAVYLPVLNALQLPAALLQSPFLDPGRPEAMDYGALGALLGHEISHGFDDQGSRFDARGRLANWWAPEDLQRFQALGTRIVDQAQSHPDPAHLPLNGRLTLSENIADLGGLGAAFDAYRISLKGGPAPRYQGLTGDQQFFLAYAQTWREKVREEVLREQLLTDPHAPGCYRALAVRNLDAWYRAFDVGPHHRLYLPPDQRIRPW